MLSPHLAILKFKLVVLKISCVKPPNPHFAFESPKPRSVQPPTTN